MPSCGSQHAVASRMARTLHLDFVGDLQLVQADKTIDDLNTQLSHCASERDQYPSIRPLLVLLVAASEIAVPHRYRFKARCQGAANSAIEFEKVQAAATAIEKERKAHADELQRFEVEPSFVAALDC